MKKGFCFLLAFALAFSVAAKVVDKPVSLVATGAVKSVTSLSTHSGASFLPSDLPNLEAWYQFNTGVTIAGAGVSVWADQTANGRDLLQGTDTNRPAHSAGVITFDGVDNFLVDTFALTQPYTIYILAKQDTYTVGRYVFDGATLNKMVLFNTTATPEISVFAGGTAAANTDWTVNQFAALAIVFNGASSSIRVGSNTKTTGDAGATDTDGLTLGARGGGSLFSNPSYKEAMIYSGAHDDATQTQVIDYLNSL